MKKILFIFSITIFFTTNLQAENISLLLQKLNNINELYHKTKTESAGLLTVYSRYDLDRMQAYKLKDILKSLRFFTYKEGYVGEAALSPSGGSSVLSSAFRLYIDDHEVSSPIYGSALLQFAEMDIGFVDHIEIYEGGNAIVFGNEPGLVTIRLYSKKVDRENGTSISLLTDNRQTKEGKICYTKETDTSSLLAYFSGGDIKRDHIYENNSDYSKDSKQSTFYIKYAFEDKGYMTLGHFKHYKDAFVGVGMRHTPLDPNEIDRISSFINLNLYLPNSFEFEASIDKMSHKMLFSDENLIYIVQNPTPFTYFNGKFSETVYKTTLKHSVEHKNGNFKWGLQGTQKKYNIDYMIMDNNLFTNPNGPTKLDILSIYAEESYNIDENNLLIGTVKLDRYHDNYNHQQDDEIILRLGYIHLFSKNTTFKTFLTKTYLYPGFAYTSTFPNIYFNNPKLQAEHYNFAIAELKYTLQNNIFKIGGLYLNSRDSIIYDSTTRRFVNSTQKQDSMRLFIDFTHKFNSQNKIVAEVYTTHFFDNIIKKSPTNGASIKSLNSIGNFDIFNEIIYRDSYIYPLPTFLGRPILIKKGYDYNAGVKWHVNHAFTLSLKGENILGKASKTPIFGLGGVNYNDKKVILQMEYFF